MKYEVSKGVHHAPSNPNNVEKPSSSPLYKLLGLATKDDIIKEIAPRREGVMMERDQDGCIRWPKGEAKRHSWKNVTGVENKKGVM